MKITFTGYRQTATLATLAGCTMAPKHERPTSPTAVVYPYARQPFLARRMPLTLAGVISSTIRFYRN